jgi:zinc protease
MLLDEAGKEGQANLTARLLTEGTKTKTPIELQEAIDDLGASISVSAGQESITLRATCLTSEFEKTVDLACEILLEPRWDEKEFARLKQQTLESIRRSKDNPASVASDVFGKLVYGRGHVLAKSPRGTEASVESLTIVDLQRYYEENFSPSVAHIALAGDLSKAQTLKAFKRLEAWQPREVAMPDVPRPENAGEAQLYFVDFPDAKQSQLRVGHLGLPYTHPDFYATTVMNYKLGGSFNSILNMILREEKGYTYGARSSFSGSQHPGRFTASSGVRSTATLDSVRIIRDELARYREGISEGDLQFTKDALTKSNTRRFETLGALLGMLNLMATYDLPADFIKQEERTVLEMTQDRHHELAQRYILPDKMIYLVVGDAKTQMAGLSELGLGDPVLLDKDANVLADEMVLTGASAP